MSTRELPWWREDAYDSHEKLWHVSEDMHNQQYQRRKQEYDDYHALYSNGRGDSSSVSGYVTRLLNDEMIPGFNAVQSIADTLAAHVTKNKVRPFFLTEDGNHELQEKAEAMTRVVETVFTESGLYGDLGYDMFLDGAVFGDGMVKICPDYKNNRVRVDRAFPWEVFVSEREGRYGKPRQIFHRQVIDRAALLDFFADDKEAVRAIEEAQSASLEDTSFEFAEDDKVADMVVVWEAWHLPTGRADVGEKKPTHDGRHVIALKGATLLDEPWAFNYFPFAHFRMMRKRKGFWGRGIAETLMGPQLALNRYFKRIDNIIHHHARPIVVVDERAHVNTNKITNSLTSILRVRGAGAVQYLTPQSVPGELFRWVERMVEFCFEQLGVSQLSASSQKPAGIESGIALQTVLDQESIRHSDVYNRWEESFIDAAHIVVDCVRMLAEENDDYKAIWGDDRSLKMIDWRKVDMEASKYQLKAWPTSLLPRSPGPRMDRVIQLKNEGIMPPEEMLRALDMPDVDKFREDELAFKKNVDRKLDAIMNGEEVIPHPYLNLEYAHQAGIKRINRMEADGYDQSAIDRMMQFVEDCEELINRAKGPAPEGPPPGEMPPPEGMPPEGMPPMPPEGMPPMPPEGMPPEGMPPELPPMPEGPPGAPPGIPPVV